MKKTLIITIVLTIILVPSTGFGMWYFMDQKADKDKTNLENEKATLEQQIKELNSQIEESKKKQEEGEEAFDTPTQKVTADFSSAEAVIRSYYKALNAHDYETAYSCFGDDFKSQNTFDMMKNAWQNIRSISILNMELKYTAASARISEYMVTESATYVNPDLVAGGDTHFIETTDVDYTGNWRIVMMTTSPINL